MPFFCAAMGCVVLNWGILYCIALRRKPENLSSFICFFLLSDLLHLFCQNPHVSFVFSFQVASLFEVLEELSPVGPKKSHFTQTMENVGQNYGFMLYRTQIPSKYANKQVELEIAGLRDRGIIFVGQVYRAFTFFV